VIQSLQSSTIVLIQFGQLTKSVPDRLYPKMEEAEL